MADRPLHAPLPADLPEDWTSGQIVAPDGAEAGLSEQHGYNYLMRQVNAAQRAVNTISESFDGVSGKRTCRFVVGSSTAGWTQADCDYLCDGVDDQVEMTAALHALMELGGGEITILAGEYNLAGLDFFSNLEGVGDISIVGSPGSTILNLTGSFSVREFSKGYTVYFYGLTFVSTGAIATLRANGVGFDIQNCTLLNVSVIYGSISNYSTSFKFQNNRVELNLDPAGSITSKVELVQVYDFYERGSDSIRISGNLFKIDVPSLHSVTGSNIIYTDAIYAIAIIENNIAVCVDSNWRIYCRGQMMLENNNLNRVRLYIEADGTVTGNRITNGSILVDLYLPVGSSGMSQVSMTGNQIINTPVFVSGPVAITGNSFLNGTEKPAVSMDKHAVNSRPELNPVIVGNFFVGGQVGIHLLAGEHVTSAPDVSHAIISSNRICGCETPIQIDASWSSCMVTDNLFEGRIVNNGTGNIVRLNSDDPGGSGGGASGVVSFKGRTGIVTPQAGDYTAAMVGAVTAEQLNAAIQAAVLDSWEGSY